MHASRPSLQAGSMMQVEHLARQPTAHSVKEARRGSSTRLLEDRKSMTSFSLPLSRAPPRPVSSTNQSVL
ncbi:hypothetical protein VTG60DRAFT_7020 [Thermothelomyces hinnuleus]